MLEIVASIAGKFVLEKSELFNKEDLLEFSLLLSYGKFDKNFFQSKRKINNEYVYVNKAMDNLNQKLDKYNSVRIWYSKIDNEDMCSLYFLVNYLSDLNKNIFVCEVSQNEYQRLGMYNPKEIKDLISFTKQLTISEISFYKKEWDRLVSENGEIRIIKGKNLISNSYEYIDKIILKQFSDKEETKYISLLANCLLEKTNGFSNDEVFRERINFLINKEKIIITKEIKEINKLGKTNIYLCKNKSYRL